MTTLINTHFTLSKFAAEYDAADLASFDARAPAGMQYLQEKEISGSFVSTRLVWILPAQEFKVYGRDEAIIRFAMRRLCHTTTKVFNPNTPTWMGIITCSDP